MIEQIEAKNDAFLNAETSARATIKKSAKTLFNYVGIFLAMAILIITILYTTTKIEMKDWRADISGLTAQFFMLILASYATYVSCSDSGMRNGMLTGAYIGAVKAHAELQERITHNRLQVAFEKYLFDYSLRKTKSNKEELLLSYEVDLEEYYSKYQNLEWRDIKKLPLSRGKKNAIHKANTMQAVSITPRMIYAHSNAGNSKHPLGVHPDVLKSRAFVRKFFLTALMSVGTTMIGCEIIIEPTLATFVSVAIRIIPLLLNAFLGYKLGFDNATDHKVSYMQNQNIIMSEFLEAQA